MISFGVSRYDYVAVLVAVSASPCRPHEREECPDGAECEQLRRLRNRGYRLDDRCHVQLFIHPLSDQAKPKFPRGFQPFQFEDEPLQLR